MKRMTILIPLMLILNLPAAAQQNAPCDGVEFRQFDFWLGSWAVFVDDERAGTNTISRSAGPCALLEQWESVRGTKGTSLNFYDPSTEEWNQVWVGEGGGVILRMTGGWSDGQMMMATSQRRVTPQGEVYDRIRWVPENGEVTQIWEISADGREWRPIFTGTYRPLGS